MHGWSIHFIISSELEKYLFRFTSVRSKSEKPVVIFYPVQGRVGKNDVKFIEKMQIVHIHMEKGKILSADFPGGFYHADRGVDAENLSVWNKQG